MIPPLSGPDLELFAATFGSPIISNTVIASGDTAETQRVDLRDGRAFAVRSIRGAQSDQAAVRIAGVMHHLALHGLPVPTATTITGPQRTWLATAWVDGESGAAWLDTPDRARTIAQNMGALSRRLATVTIDGLPFDDGLDPALGATSRHRLWLDVVRAGLGPPTVRRVDQAIDRLSALPPRPPVLRHGDFAPINVILDTDGTIVALLDLEHASPAPTMSDVAWWGWVVRHHHPDIWSATWDPFCRAAEVPSEPSTNGEVWALQVIRLLEHAATVAAADAQGRWLQRLAEAAAW